MMEDLTRLEDFEIAINEAIRSDFFDIFNNVLAGIVFLVIILVFASYVSSFLDKIFKK